MSRKTANVEYLERLIEWAGGKTNLCNLTGIKSSNLSDYLAGNKNVTWERLKRATEQILGQPPAFHAVVEGYDVVSNGLPKVAVLPKKPGIYALFDSAMRIIYYGKAKSLYAEVRQTLGRKVGEVRPWTGTKNLKFRDITQYISAYTLIRGDATFYHDVEAFGLRLMVNNTFNKKGGTFKRKK